MASVEFSRRATLDLIRIEDYSIEMWGRKVAERYLDGFNHAIERLQAHPDLLKTEQDLSSRLKFYRVEQHFLICDVIDETIYIVAIRHGSMDLPAMLDELEPRLIEESELLHRQFLTALKT
ncbi:MAG: type II toxin-antitoxin system RelE/ParE family toxin, partial [bacterium]|nr:type II toxin-antitoxin system RelE/ParE family toxin [bacterium]